MSEVKVRNGSYKVHMPVGGKSVNMTRVDSNTSYSIFPGDYEQSDRAQHTVSMLTQQEYAHGWQQVLPKRRLYIKTTKVNDVEVEKLGSNVYKLKVNLCQLPSHLWGRSSNVINDNIYQYTVERTNVDTEIIELYNIVNEQYNPSNKERVTELLNILKDNDVFGWVVIRALYMYN
jgi:hypothetical protein